MSIYMKIHRVGAAGSPAILTIYFFCYSHCPCCCLFISICFFPFMNILSVIFGMKFIYCLLHLVLSKICITFVYLAHTFQFLKQGIQPAHTSSPQFLANIKCGIGDGPKSKHKPCPHFLASKVKNSDFSNTNFCARKTSCGLKLNHLPHRTPSARPNHYSNFWLR